MCCAVSVLTEPTVRDELYLSAVKFQEAIRTIAERHGNSDVRIDEAIVVVENAMRLAFDAFGIPE